MLKLAIIACAIAQTLSAPSGCSDLCQTSSINTQNTHHEALKDSHQSLTDELHRDYNRPGNWTEHNDFKTPDGAGHVHEERGQVVGENSKMRYYKKNYAASYGSYGAGVQTQNSGLQSADALDTIIQQRNRVNSQSTYEQNSLLNQQRHQSGRSSRLEDFGENVDTSLTQEKSGTTVNADSDNWTRHNSYVTDGGHGKVYEEEGQYNHGPAKVRYYKKNYTSSYSSAGPAPVLPLPDITSDLAIQARQLHAELDQISHELRQGHQSLSQVSQTHANRNNNWRENINNNEYNHQHLQSSHNQHYQRPVGEVTRTEHHEQHSSRQEHHVTHGGHIPNYVVPDDMQTSESQLDYQQQSYQPSGYITDSPNHQSPSQAHQYHTQGRQYESQTQGYQSRGHYQQQSGQYQQQQRTQNNYQQQTNDYQQQQQTQGNYQQHTNDYQQQQRTQGHDQSQDRQRTYQGTDRQVHAPSTTESHYNYRDDSRYQSQEGSRHYADNDRYRDASNQQGRHQVESTAGRHVEEQWDSSRHRVEQTYPHNSGSSQRLDNFDDTQQRTQGSDLGLSHQGSNRHVSGSSSSYHQQYQSQSGNYQSGRSGQFRTGVVDMGHGVANCDTEQTGSQHQRRYKRDVEFGQETQQFEDMTHQMQGFQDYTQQQSANFELDHQQTEQVNFGQETQQHEDLTQQTHSFGQYGQQQHLGNLELVQQTESLDDLTQQTQQHEGLEFEKQTHPQRYESYGQQQQTGRIELGSQRSQQNSRNLEINHLQHQQSGNLEFDNQYYNQRDHQHHTGNQGYGQQTQKIDDLAQQTHGFDDYYQQQHSGNFELSQQHQQQHSGNLEFGHSQQTEDLSRHDHHIQKISANNNEFGLQSQDDVHSQVLKPAPKPISRSQRLGSGPRSDIEPSNQQTFGQDSEIRPVNHGAGVKGGSGRGFRPQYQPQYPNQDLPSSGVLSLEEQDHKSQYSGHQSSSQQYGQIRQASVQSLNQEPESSTPHVQSRLVEAYGGHGQYERGYDPNIYSTAKVNPSATLSPISSEQDPWEIRERPSDEISVNRVRSLESSPDFQTEPDIISTTPAPGFWKKVGQKITSSYEKAKDKITNAFG